MLLFLTQVNDDLQNYINKVNFLNNLKYILEWVFLILGIIAFIKIIFTNFHR